MQRATRGAIGASGSAGHELVARLARLRSNCGRRSDRLTDRPPRRVQPVSRSAMLLISRIVPLEVGRDDAVTDAAQRHREALGLGGQRLLGAPGLEQRLDGLGVKLPRLFDVTLLILGSVRGTRDRCGRSGRPAPPSSSPASDDRAAMTMRGDRARGARHHEARRAPEEVLVPDPPDPLAAGQRDRRRRRCRC